MQVLGPVRVAQVNEGGEGDGAAHLGGKSRAVLAWLACRPEHAGSRAALLDLLWNDSAVDQARAAMRQCLFHLRRAFAPADAIRTDRESVRFVPGAIEVDLDRFLRLASSDRCDDLVVACDMYRGDVAEHLQGPPEFTAWLSAERRKVRTRAGRLLERTAAVVFDGADAGVVEQLACRILSTDPLHEGCWRALMTVHARCGLRAEAEAAWQECRRVLRAEAGVEPGDETRRTHDALDLAQRRTWPLAVGSRSAAEVHPDDAAAAAHDHFLRGWQHYFNGSATDNALARKAYQAAAALAPERSDFAAHAAWTYFTDFQFCWNASPARSVQRATALALDLTRRFPTEPWPRALEAKLRLWRGEFAQALEGLEAARSSRPDSAPLWANSADALLRTGQAAKALTYVGHAMALNPDDRGYFLFLAGQIRFALHDLDGARASFEAALRRNSQYCLGYGGLVAVLSELGRCTDAEEAAAKSEIWKIAPGLQRALHVLGPYADEQLAWRWKRAWLRVGGFSSA